MSATTRDRREVLAALLHKSFHDAWGGPADPLSLYADSPIWRAQAERLDAALAAQEGERGGAEVAAIEGRLGSLSTLVDVATRNYGDGPLHDPYYKGIAFAVGELQAALADSAGALAKHDAEVLRAAADEAEAIICDGDVAEVAAHVPGEVGRASAVGKRDALYEEPYTWLRDRADRIEAQS